MSISIITCDCGSAEQLVRKHLHKYEYKNWAMEPIKKGKIASLNEIERLIRRFQDNSDLKSLFAHVNNVGKWCVIIGYTDNGNVKWSDISHNDMKSDVEAELIVQKFS